MEIIKTAVIYARQSSGADDFSESVETQIENCKQLAKQENIKVLGVFSDLNTSGKTYPTGAEKVAENDLAFNNWFSQQTGNKKFRSGLGEVISKLPEIDYIIVDEMTRLYRPVTRSYLENYINNALTDNDVTVLQVKGGKIDLSKFDQSLITMLKNAINDEQIANQRKKSMQQLRKRKDNGFFANGGGKAWGTVYNIMDGSISIQKDHIPVIKYIFDEIERYTPYLQIIQYLNAHFKHLVRKCFYYTNLYHIVENPLYCGFMTNSEGFLIRNKQIKNPCITFCQWKKVKDMVQKRKGKPVKARVNWLPFSGLLFCGNCGSRLVASVDKGKIFYFCLPGGGLLKNPECKGSRVLIESNRSYYAGLYAAIKPLLIIILFKALDEWKSADKYNMDLEKLEQKTEKLKAKQHGITEMYIKGLLNIEDMEKNLSDIKERLRKLQEKKLMLQNKRTGGEKNYEKTCREFPLEIFTSDKISQSDYEIILKEVIKKIEVYTFHISVTTVFGIVKLPRFRSRRYFPVPQIDVLGTREDMTCTITYYNGKKSILADWGKIKIKTA